MQADLLTLDSSMADDERLPDLHRHLLSIDEIEAIGWGMSWLPGDAPRLPWLADDDLCPPERVSIPVAPWDSWQSQARFSP